MRETDGKEDFSLIYDGFENPDTTHFLMEDHRLTQKYKPLTFYVVAKNFNGEGEPSDELQSRTCLEPKDMEIPRFI